MDNTMNLSREKLISLYETMIRIRRFEETAVAYFKQGIVIGNMHMYVGEEATATGVCAALEKEDYVSSTHRCDGHLIAKGADINRMMAELMGKEEGLCGGRAGKMHQSAPEVGLLCANGIVGASAPLATGHALACSLYHPGRIACAFFGDGGGNQGVVHESMNMAAVWKLPVIFVVENNHYAITTSVESSTALGHFYQRAAGYGIPGVLVDGNDVLAVYHAAKEAADRARRGEGPTYIECDTYRYRGHHEGDDQVYRTKEEVEQVKETRDCIERMKKHLEENEGWTEAEENALRQKVEDDILAAVDFGMRGTPMDPASIYDNLFAPDTEGSSALLPGAEKKEGKRRIMYREAVAEAIAEEMRRDDKIFVMGEDVAISGGVYKATRGLLAEFGPERVRNTPLAEVSIAGAATGAAMAGARPVAEIMHIDFTGVAGDIFLNQMPKMHYKTNGQVSVPLVVRTQQGVGHSNGCTQSQSLESLFTHIPGYKVVCPSTPYDVKGLLKSAIRDNNPVMFIEHKALYQTKGEVPEEEYTIPLGLADVKREGTDATIITYSRTVKMALEAAEKLANEGISAEIVDIRTLVPLDFDTIAASVKKTGHVVIAHESCGRTGYGAEIAAEIQEKLFDELDAPILRVCGADIPVPNATEAELASIPSADRIADAVRRIV